MGPMHRWEDNIIWIHVICVREVPVIYSELPSRHVTGKKPQGKLNEGSECPS